jgi:hypothetical protein
MVYFICSINFKISEKMDVGKDGIRSLLSEILKLLSTPEYQTQLEKTRQTSANDAVALLQNVNLSFNLVKLYLSQF